MASIRMICFDVAHFWDLHGQSMLCAISLPRRVPLCCRFLPTVASSSHCVPHSIKLGLEQTLRHEEKGVSSKTFDVTLRPPDVENHRVTS
jgi:hypothetical protein